MNHEAPGILEVLTGNKRMLFGAVMLLLALILAFSAIYKEAATYSREGTVAPGETIGIEKRRPENEGRFNLKPDRESVSETVEVALLNENREPLRKVYPGGKDDSTVEISRETSYFKLVSGEGSYGYEYHIKFSYQPFRWLSIPAALFTVFGVIAIYRGFDEFMADFAKERAQESEEELEEEGQHVDFMGINNEEGED